MKRAGLQCDSCKRLGGKARELQGQVPIMCGDCWGSHWRRMRVLERLTGTPASCDCGTDCGANQRAREANA